MKYIALMALAGLCLVPAASTSHTRRMSSVLLQEAAPRNQTVPPGSSYREVFEKVENGLTSGNIHLFSQFLGSQVLVNLRGGESGYYSASQAYYLLENYLKPRKLARFTFSTISESAINPFATGSVAFNYRGNREYGQVYVSLSLVGDRWMITQINIY